MLVFAACMTGTPLLTDALGFDGRTATAASMAVLTVMLDALFALILAGGYVYWINGGPSFEEAREVGAEMRREYAWKHFRTMLSGSFAALAALAIEYVAGASELAMILSTVACISVAAIFTGRIHWMIRKDVSEH